MKTESNSKWCEVYQHTRQLMVGRIYFITCCGRVDNLQPFPLELLKVLVVRHLLHNAPHLGPELLVDLLQRGVCVLHRVV